MYRQIPGVRWGDDKFETTDTGKKVRGVEERGLRLEGGWGKAHPLLFLGGNISLDERSRRFLGKEAM